MKRIVSLLLAASLLLTLCACGKEQGNTKTARALLSQQICTERWGSDTGARRGFVYEWTENGCKVFPYQIESSDEANGIDPKSRINEYSMHMDCTYDREARTLQILYYDKANGRTDPRVDLYLTVHYTQDEKIDWIAWDSDDSRITYQQSGDTVILQYGEREDDKLTAALDRERGTALLQYSGVQTELSFSEDGYSWASATGGVATCDGEGNLRTLLNKDGEGVLQCVYEGKQTAAWQQTVVLLNYMLWNASRFFRDEAAKVSIGEEAVLLLGLYTYMN